MKFCVRAEAKPVFIVHNTFRVKPTLCNDFEIIWKTRKSYLNDVKGFVSFTFMRSIEKQGEYISQTIWDDKKCYEDWLQSAEFSKIHGGENSKRFLTMLTILEDHPLVWSFMGLHEQKTKEIERID